MPVEGTVIAKVKGGLSVDIGVKAFLTWFSS
jgi:ribosomal protein S1